MGRPLSGSPQANADAVKSKAAELGFDACRITDADLPGTIRERLKAALHDGYHGTMDWMESRVDERSHPKSLWPQAKSVIIVGTNYGPDTDPLTDLQNRECGNISVYARHQDYHDIIKKRMKQLGRWIASEWGEELKVFVDTAPVMEKPLAAQAGLGWQGKHTNLVSRDFGSWLFLGAVFTTAELPIDPPETDHCGNCRACLDVCPTDAFPAPYRLDARRCLSYLTIEHKGVIPLEFRKPMGNRIYGCDDCLAVCPWNKFAQTTHHAKLRARDDLNQPKLADLAALDDAAFRAHFSKSPIKRIGRDRFMRNILIAIGNSEDKSLLPTVERFFLEPYSVLRSTAIWSWRQLGGAPDRLLKAFADETDPAVLEELTR